MVIPGIDPKVSAAITVKRKCSDCKGRGCEFCHNGEVTVPAGGRDGM